MVKIVTATKKYDCEHLLGKFLDDDTYDTVVNEDMDFYALSPFGEENSEKNLLFKFRKNVFSKELQQLAYDTMSAAAIRTENRGLASGTKDGASDDAKREWVTNYQQEMLGALVKFKNASLSGDNVIDSVRVKYPTKESRQQSLGTDAKGIVWVISRYRGKFDFEAWVDSLIPMSPTKRAEETEEVMKLLSDTSYGNPVNSGIAGFFTRYPRIPYMRACAFNENNPEKYNESLPYFQLLSKKFKGLLPERYKAQSDFCKKIDSRYVVEGTVFTTLTINKTFRTAAHRDAGDLAEGFSNLTCVDNGKEYSGGWLILPEYRIAVNLRPGDLLFINNHEGIHGNTPIVEVEEGAERISFVCYAREGMLEGGTKEYEDCRKEFVEQCKADKSHKHWRPLFNGIFPGMFQSKEWYDFLESKLGIETLHKYHPETNRASLEDLFA